VYFERSVRVLIAAAQTNVLRLDQHADIDRDGSTHRLARSSVNTHGHRTTIVIRTMSMLSVELSEG
jgi:hypothetical protein